LFFFFCIYLFNSGRAAKAPNWNGESGYRLHVSPLNPRTSRRDIENIFSKYGTINEVYLIISLANLAMKNLGLDGNESTLFCLCKF
jgi:RNA recognition motif-containing protein